MNNLVVTRVALLNTRLDTMQARVCATIVELHSLAHATSSELNALVADNGEAYLHANGADIVSAQAALDLCAALFDALFLTNCTTVCDCYAALRNQTKDTTP